MLPSAAVYFCLYIVRSTWPMTRNRSSGWDGRELFQGCGFGNATNNTGSQLYTYPAAVPHLPTSRRPAYSGISFHLWACAIVFRTFCPPTCHLRSSMTLRLSPPPLAFRYYIHLNVFVSRVQWPHRVVTNGPAELLRRVGTTPVLAHKSRPPPTTIDGARTNSMLGHVRLSAPANQRAN